MRALQLFLLVATTAFALLIAVLCIGNFAVPKPLDFLSFWAAGNLASTGAYDVTTHAARESVALGRPIMGALPFPYPPAFLLMVVPFGLLPYPAAMVVWLLVTGLLLAAAVRPEALGHPCAFIAAAAGQISFLTTALFAGGFRLLDRRPVVGGAILGFLIVKPQLAVLVPVALLAGRRWKAIAAGAVSASAVSLAALLALGPAAYSGFLAMLPRYSQMLVAGSWSWNEVASVFAFARYFGVPTAPALAAQAVVAAFAVVAAWRAWRCDAPDKVPLVASATLLIPPYIFGYDYLLLAIPFAAMVRDRPAAAVSIWLLCLPSVLWSFGLYDGPNTLPVAAIFALFLLATDQPDVPLPIWRRRPSIRLPHFLMLQRSFR